MLTKSTIALLGVLVVAVLAAIIALLVVLSPLITWAAKDVLRDLRRDRPMLHLRTYLPRISG